MSEPATTQPGSTGDRVDFITLVKSSLRFVSEQKWLFAAAGVIGVVVHFWRIGYLPQITVADVGLVASATAFFSFVALVFFLLVVMGPALCFVAWSTAEFIPKAPSSRLRARRRRSPRPPCTHCQRPFAKSHTPNFVAKAMLPTLLIAYGGFLVAAAVWWVLWRVDLPQNWSTIAAGLTLLASGIGLCFGMSNSAPATFSARKERRRNRWAKYFWLCVSLYGLVIPIILMVGWALLRGVESNQSTANLVLLLALPALHVMTYALQSSGVVVRATALVAMGFYIVFFTGAAFAISDLAAAKFRLGMLKGQDVLVTPLGCDLARLSGVAKKCGSVAGESGNLLCLKNVKILTRLGNHVLITDLEWRPQKPSPSVAIPTAEIRGWFSTPRDEKDADFKREPPTIQCALSSEAASVQGTKPK